MQYFRITAPQKAILDVIKIYGNTGITNICGALIFETKLDTGLLEAAVNAVLSSQSGMRLRFCVRGGETVQYVSGYKYEKFGYMDFSCREELKNFGEGSAAAPFELYDSQMYRITLFGLEGKSGIILCASHLITDAWTFSILANEVYEAYCGLTQNKDTAMTEYRYTDLVRSEEKYFSSQAYLNDKAYWDGKYAEKYSAAYISIPEKSGCAPEADRAAETVPAEAADEIRTFCERNGISAPVLFETAAAVYLSKTDLERKPVTLGVPVLNRSGGKEKHTAGNYVLTVPVTVTVSDDETALSVCEKISKCSREAFRHRRYPYAEILKSLNGRNGSRGGLYSVLLSCQNARTNIAASTVWFKNGFSEIPLSIHFDVRDSTGGYTVTADYRKDVFSCSDEVPLILKRIIHIIKQIVSDKDIAVGNIAVMPDEEYQKVIYGSNGTAAAYPENKCVHELFAEYAAKNPDKTALVFRGKSYTYRELDEMSDPLARFLREKGIGRNDIVPIISVRSPYMITAMLAVLKAGGAYMPVSPDYPAKRISSMIRGVGAKLALTCGAHADNIENVNVEDIGFPHGTAPIKNINTSDDLCYIIYTSGSSGTPKGTAVTHKNVVNYCSDNAMNVCHGIFDRNTAGIVSVTDFVFDIFVTESILPLLNGIKIVLADDEQVVSQDRLSRLIKETGASVIQTTPTKMRSYILNRNNTDYLAVLKKVILGGERFPPDLYNELKKHTDAEIYNIYGPAETTVWSAFGRIDDPNDITVGRPAANTMIYILDKSGAPMPSGTAGELCISGCGVGKGYVNDEKLTAEKFFPDPFVNGNTVYRTGDLAKLRTDGKIEFLGRTDSQVKIRGMRVEPGEIESAMTGFDGIDLAAVRFIDDGNGVYAAAYYTAEKAIGTRELRSYLSDILPAYMVPRCFVKIDSMPLTPSGKTDRKSLPLPDINQLSEDSYSAPVTMEEKLLCGIIAELLNISRAGAEDDFFEIGGDSFRAIELSVKAEENGLDIPVQSVFIHRTVRKMCADIGAVSVPSRQYDTEKYPLRRTVSDIALFDMLSYLSKKIYKFEVYGLEALDLSKKYIFCPNHESDLDCLWVWAALGRRVDINDTCALIAGEHLDKAVSRKIFRINGGIPVDRGGDFLPALERAEKVLSDEKKYLLIHPEGTRTRTGRLGSFRTGAAVISENTGISIVPVCIRGARKIFPPSVDFPKLIDPEISGRYRLQIKFGKPIAPCGADSGQLMEKVRRQIIAMKRGMSK